VIRVFVSCYNYGSFLNECLRSVAVQSVQDLRCTIIDDGSVDDSEAVARLFLENDSRFQYVKQANAGQLSVFNLAARDVGDDDLVFFLDADDIWAKTHVAEVLRAHEQFPDCTFFFTSRLKFSDRVEFPNDVGVGQLDLLPPTSGVARCFYCWIGNVTSALCLKGSLLKRILPYPYTSEWKVRADDLLVLGASVCGAAKCHSSAQTVGYRVHSNNNHFGAKSETNVSLCKRLLALERFFNWLCQKESLDRVPPPFLVAEELRVYESWSRWCFNDIRYRSIWMQNWPLFHRLKIFIILLLKKWRVHGR
jgi:glycosyltransferase involved in cell wall biosynthesis